MRRVSAITEGVDQFNRELVPIYIPNLDTNDYTTTTSTTLSNCTNRMCFFLQQLFLLVHCENKFVNITMLFVIVCYLLQEIKNKFLFNYDFCILSLYKCL